MKSIRVLNSFSKVQWKIYNGNRLNRTMEFISSLMSPRADNPNTGDMTFDSENDNWSWPSEEAERAKLYVSNDCVRCLLNFD